MNPFQTSTIMENNKTKMPITGLDMNFPQDPMTDTENERYGDCKWWFQCSNESGTQSLNEELDMEMGFLDEDSSDNESMTDDEEFLNSPENRYLAIL